jgi:hypothetical protein
MLPAEHAPRLVLGLASTAPKELATTAFAKASQRLKQMSDPPFEKMDLTTALSQLEAHSQDHLKFEYRVPANGEILSSGDEWSGGDLNAQTALAASIDLLLQWDWDGAREKAKSVLLSTQRENLRDEALNVIAASLALTGDMEGAIEALKRAVEGEWNYALQQNLGILALQSDPMLAANQSAYWLDSATTTKDREQAIFYVLKMWSNAEGGDDFEVPEKIRISFRTALISGLTEEMFAQLGLFLARTDANWIITNSEWKEANNNFRAITPMIVARAQGFDEFIDFLASQASSPIPTIAQSREDFIGYMIDDMFQQDEAMGSASCAIQFIDGGLPCSNNNEALLRILAVREISLYLRDREEEPSERFIGWLEDAHRYVLGVTDADLREAIMEILIASSSILTILFVTAREKDIGKFDAALSTIYQMSQRWGGRRRLNKHEAIAIARSTREWADGTEKALTRLRSLPITDTQVQGWVTQLSAVNARIGAMSRSVLEKM